MSFLHNYKFISLYLLLAIGFKGGQELAHSVITSEIIWSLLFGVLLAFTPCVLPMVPMILSIIVGKNHQISKLYAVSHTLIYVLAMSLIYAASGVLAGLFGHNLQAELQHPIAIAIVSLFLIFLSFEILEILSFKLPISFNLKLYKIEKHQNKGSIVNAIMLGILAALVITPCITPALAGIITFLAEEGSPVKGGIYLFAMGLGIGTPLLAFAIGGSHLLPKTGGWMVTIKKITGFIILALAIWLLERIISMQISMLLWGVFAIFLALHLGLFTPNNNSSSNSAQSRLYQVNRLVRVVIFIDVVVLIIGGL